MYTFRKTLTGLTLLIAALSMNAATSGDVLMPNLPAAKGDQCVEPSDIMRRNHYDFMRHKRDKTMRNGIRTSKHSLVECINCHVLADENNQYVSHESDEHFCSSCHVFAAVKIDCFECHADKPTDSPEPITHKQDPADSVIYSSLYHTQLARDSYE